ncbi:MAG: hypothetical protein ACKVVT_16935 [Dehalococcoidia bacterium]
MVSFKSKAAIFGLSGIIAVTSVAGVALAEGGSGRHGQKHVAGIAIRHIVEESGLDASVFKEGAKAGKSIDQVLTENGLDPDTIEAALLAELDAKLDERVADEKITREKADELAAKAATGLDKLMSATPDPDRRGGGHLSQGVRGLLKVAADTIGVTPQELATELKEGDTTIAEVATQNGVDPQDVIDAMVAAANAKIDEAVANNKITAEKGDELKERSADRIAKIVNEGLRRER